MITITTLLIIVGIWLVISFSSSMMEACLLSISRADLAAIEARSATTGAIWRGFKERMSAPLAVILILNTFAHTIGAAMSGSIFQQLYGDGWLWAFSLGISFVMIQWTEILPKSLGSRHNRVIAPALAIPLRAAVGISRPIVWLIHFLNRPFERRSHGQAPDPLEDIHALARFAAMTEHIDPAQEKMIASATGLSTRTVRDLMIPRDEISFLSSSMSLNEALVKAHEDGHTRYPLCKEGDLDQLPGYVNFKELVSALRTNPENATLTGICRPLQRVSPDWKASVLLRAFVQDHQHVAIVQDEQGKTVGLVTLEDILESPLGALESDFGRPLATILRIDVGRWMVGGGATVAALREKLGKDLKELPTEGTVSEWIVEKTGQVPFPNQKLEAGGLTATVRRVRRRKVYDAMIVEDPESRRKNQESRIKNQE